MTLKELIEIYKEIYGDENVEFSSFDYVWTLCPNLLYSLDYFNDEFRNVVNVVEDEYTNEFYLTDSRETYYAFTQKELFEVTPTILALLKKYNIELKDNMFAFKLEKFDKNYLKEKTSNFMCFMYSVWHFCLHLSKYKCAFLERGYYYDESIESQVLFKGESFENVLKTCKDKFENFAYDSEQRLYYILEDNQKKYLLKLLDGYTFSSIAFRNEQILTHDVPNAIDMSLEKVVDILKQALEGKFDTKDLSYQTVVYKNKKPLKVFLMQENGKFFFTDKGIAKANLSSNIDDNELAKYTNTFTIVNGEIRCYLGKLLTQKVDAIKFYLNMELNRIVLVGQDLQEFDFSNIGKFETSLNTYKNVLDFLKERVRAKVFENGDCAEIQVKLKVISNKQIKFNFEKGDEFNYLTFKNTLGKTALSKFLKDLKSNIVYYDNVDNKFKTPIYENDQGKLSNKIYNMVQFILFYQNYKKITFGKGILDCKNDKTNQDICTYAEMYKKLNQKANKEDFFGYYVGETWIQRKDSREMVIFFFNAFYEETVKVCAVQIKNTENGLVVFNDKLENAKDKNPKQINNLFKKFGLADNSINLTNSKHKISSMVQLFIYAKCLGLIN